MASQLDSWAFRRDSYIWGFMVMAHVSDFEHFFEFLRILLLGSCLAAGAECVYDWVVGLRAIFSKPPAVAAGFGTEIHLAPASFFTRSGKSRLNASGSDGGAQSFALPPRAPVDNFKLYLIFKTLQTDHKSNKKSLMATQAGANELRSPHPPDTAMPTTPTTEHYGGCTPAAQFIASLLNHTELLRRSQHFPEGPITDALRKAQLEKHGNPIHSDPLTNCKLRPGPAALGPCWQAGWRSPFPGVSEAPGAMQ